MVAANRPGAVASNEPVETTAHPRRANLGNFQSDSHRSPPRLVMIGDAAALNLIWPHRPQTACDQRQCLILGCHFAVLEPKGQYVAATPSHGT